MIGYMFIFIIVPELCALIRKLKAPSLLSKFRSHPKEYAFRKILKTKERKTKKISLVFVN